MDIETNARLDQVFKKWEKTSNAARVKEDVIRGKDRWIDKHGSNPAPIRRFANKYKTPSRRQKVQHDGYSGFIPNLGIKISHEAIQITHGHKCCDRCTPQSHVAWRPHTNRLLNLVDTQSHRRFGFFQYYCNDIYTCSNLKVSSLPETKKSVLNSDEVRNEIDTYSDKKYAVSKADSLFETIRAHSWSVLAKVAGWVLMKVFQMSTSGIFVEQKEIEILRQAVQTKVPVLYLPLHRSHLDYIILMFVLCLSDLPSPFVAAGDNLNIPIIGPFLRKVGAFYIRRRPKEDHDLYKAVLGQYMIELLKDGCCVEFFLEGRRSRSGLINPSKVGLLGQIVSAVKDGIIGDVLLCPLSITYDKVPEESLTLELQGAKKEAENVFSSLWNCITFPIRQHYGAIRVNFSAPFSLSEFIEKTISEIRLPTDTWINAADMDTGSVFRLATRLGDHVLYNAMETSSITKISLVSVLLFNVSSKTSQTDLEKKGLLWKTVFSALKKEPPFKFNGRYLSEPLKAFTNCLDIKEEKIDDEMLTMITRYRDSKIDLLLHYYSAPIVVFSLSISALCISIPQIVKTDINGVSTVSKSMLMRRAQYICGLLESTVKCNPPCIAIDQQLSFDLDQLFTLEIFKPKQSSISTTDQSRMNKAAAIWDDSQGDNEWYDPEPYDDKLIVNMDNVDSCFQVGSILLPYIKTLWFILDHINIVTESLQITKSEFVDELCLLGEEEFGMGLRLALCTSRFHVDNFVDKLIAIKVMFIEKEYLKLSEDYDGSEKFLQMVSYISTYLADR